MTGDFNPIVLNLDQSEQNIIPPNLNLSWTVSQAGLIVLLYGSRQDISPKNSLIKNMIIKEIYSIVYLFKLADNYLQSLKN